MAAALAILAGLVLGGLVLGVLVLSVAIRRDERAGALRQPAAGRVARSARRVVALELSPTVEHAEEKS